MIRLVFALLGLLIVSNISQAQGRLERVRFATGASSDTPGNASLGSPSTLSSLGNGLGKIFDSTSGDDDSDLAKDIVIGAGVVAGLTAPFWLPYWFFDEGAAKFPSYPYEDAGSGFLVFGTTNAKHYEDDEGGILRPWSLRIGLADGNSFDGLNRLSGQFFLDMQSRFGFLSNWNYYQESLGGGLSDHTWLADNNVTFRFVQSEELEMHFGAGLRMQLDRAGDQFGSNFLYRADVYPIQPLHISGTFALGNLGHAMVEQADIECGLNYQNAQAFIGYQFLRIGRVDLQGPLIGLRLWF